MSRTNSKKVAAKKKPDIKPVKPPKATVQCTKMQLTFYTELLLDGKVAGQIQPQSIQVFEKDFDKPIDFVKAAEAVCEQVQKQIDEGRMT